MRIIGTNLFTDLQLGEPSQVPKKIQILRVGKFNHPTYGFFEITEKTLSDMKANFDQRVRGIDVSFDYYHEANEDASGWVEDLILEENGTQLWAVVNWTPKATQKLADRELRYFSPDFAFSYKDPETGQTYENVLFGGGLTNRPFVKEMAAIVANEINERVNMTELEKAQKELKDLQAANVKLAEEKTAAEKKLSEMAPPSEMEAMKKKLSEMEAQLMDAKKEKEMLMGELAQLKEAKKLSEKESEFNVLLSEGKACAAQKDAFLKGDMAEFIKLAQPVNTKGAGNSNNPNDTEADRHQKVLKLAEEKRKADPKLGHADSISLALKELAK